MEEKICKLCVMDSSDPDIRFYGEAGCSNCKDARKRIQAARKDIADLHRLARQVKEAGRGKKYDCVIGVSGGVDSSFVAHMVSKMGLRPIAIHLDNGWDSPQAVANMEKMLGRLGIELHCHKVDEKEFRDLQLAFLKASTPDSEIPSDHAISAGLYQMAAKHRIKYIISGHNINSESILPAKWSHGHADWKYIRGIQKQFGNCRLKSFPHYSRWKKMYYDKMLKIKNICILDYIDYDKEKAKRFMQEKYQWQDYEGGGKHYESIYTRFYQAYILPEKFGYDKRRCHLSSLIAAGQLSREEALRELEKPLYDPDILERDMRCFLEKMQLTEDEFRSIMKSPKKSYWDYPNYETDWLRRHFGL